MIKPTVGRVVWFHPAITDHSLASGGDQPLAALVAHVWSDTCINLAVFDANGLNHSRTSVLLLQDDAVAPEGGFYAEWMPFQKGQAEKSDAKQTLTEYDRIEAVKLAIGGIYRGFYPSYGEYIEELDRFARYLKTGDMGVKS